MRKLSLLLLLINLAVIHPNLWSQTKMTASSNMPRYGDTVCKRHIEYFAPGAEGQGMTWDFRDIKSHDKKHDQQFYRDSDSTMLYGLESDIVQKYVFHNDSLQTTGYENRLQTMNYQHPITLLSFPCSYGDHSRQEYHGLGAYCQKYVLETSGTMESDIDALGTILLNDEDTLHQVLRLHQVYSADIAQYLPEDTLPTMENNKRRVEDRYQWYARGYRYPVFETVCVTIYNDGVPVTCQKRAYCTLPSDQILLEDSINKRILYEDSLEHLRAEEPPIIRYLVSVEPTDITIHYSLDSDASINVIVCDRMGVVYRRSSSSDSAGSSGVIRINRNGLKSGIYVLYINVNGQIFSEKLELH